MGLGDVFERVQVIREPDRWPMGFGLGAVCPTLDQQTARTTRRTVARRGHWTKSSRGGGRSIPGRPESPKGPRIRGDWGGRAGNHRRILQRGGGIEDAERERWGGHLKVPKVPKPGHRLASLGRRRPARGRSQATAGPLCRRRPARGSPGRRIGRQATAQPLRAGRGQLGGGPGSDACLTNVGRAHDHGWTRA